MASSTQGPLQSVQRYSYAVFLMTPSSPSPTFISELHASGIKFLFAGDDTKHFRKTHPTDWGWSHVFVVPEDHKNALRKAHSRIMQQWNFTIESHQEFATYSPASPSQGSEQASNAMVPRPTYSNPSGLVGAMQYWWRSGDPRLYVLTFAKFNNEGEEEKYKEYVSLLKSFPHDKYGVEVHVSGRVTNNTPIVGSTTVIHEADPGDFFSLLSFPTDHHYAQFLESEELKSLREDIGLTDVANAEGMVLTQDLHLPPENEPINPMSWGKYGNPYEPYGMDFFG